MHTRGTRYLVITRCRSGTAPNPNPNPKQEWHGAAKTGQLACLERLLAAEPWLLQARYLVITPTSLAARGGAVAAPGTLPSYHPYQPWLLQALYPNPYPNPGPNPYPEPNPNPNPNPGPNPNPTRPAEPLGERCGATARQHRAALGRGARAGTLPSYHPYTALHWAAAHGQARYLVITPTPRCTGPRRTGRHVT